MGGVTEVARELATMLYLDNMKIKLGGKHKDKFCLIDDEDYEKVKDKKWYGISPKRSGTTYVTDSKGMHIYNLIIGKNTGFVVDHINGNGLDNRKSNLRFCTQKQNSRNNRRRKGGYSSKFKGVWKYNYDSGRVGWASQIMVNGEKKHLGIFRDEEKAAYAYNLAAKKYFGEYAKLNDLPKDDYDLPTKKERKQRRLKNLENRQQTLITYKNETHNIRQWAKIKDIKRQTLQKRLKSGWTIEDSLNKPVGGKSE